MTFGSLPKPTQTNCKIIYLHVLPQLLKSEMKVSRFISPNFGHLEFGMFLKAVTAEQEGSRQF